MSVYTRAPADDLMCMQLNGSIPQWGSGSGMAAMQKMDLSSNSLTGALPASLNALNNLQIFTAANNTGLCGVVATAGNSNTQQLRYALPPCQAPPPPPNAAAPVSKPAPAPDSGSNTGGIAGMLSKDARLPAAMNHSISSSSACISVQACMGLLSRWSQACMHGGPAEAFIVHAGGVVGGLAALLLGGAVLLYFRRRKQSRKVPPDSLHQPYQCSGSWC